MKEEPNKKYLFCPHCDGTGHVVDNDDINQSDHCPMCGATFRVRDFEIKVEGQIAEEVSQVTSQLIKRAIESYPSKQSLASTFKNSIMGLFSKKVKCKRFYETQSRMIDITGLKTGLPNKFDFGLGSLKLDTKYHEASEQLKKLDMLQFGLCNDINGISDQTQKDKLLTKIIETKTKMMEIVLEITNTSVTNNNNPHFNYLTKDDLINLLLHFNSDAFTTPFRLEESLISYTNRISDVKNLIGSKIEHVHPNYKRYVIEILDLLKALKRLSNHFNEYTMYIPWQPDSLATDIIRYSVVLKVNNLLLALQAPDRIKSERFIKDSYLVTEAHRYKDLDRAKQVEDELIKVKQLFNEENLDTQIIDFYFGELKKLMISA